MFRALLSYHNVHVTNKNPKTLKDHLDEERICQILSQVEKTIYDTVIQKSEAIGEPWTSRVSSFYDISGWWHDQINTLFANQFLQSESRVSGLVLFDTLKRFAESLKLDPTTPTTPTSPSHPTSSSSSRLDDAKDSNQEDVQSVATSAVNDWVKDFQDESEDDIHSIFDDFEKLQN